MTQVMMYKARGTECGQALLQKSWVVYAKRLAGPRETLGDETCPKQEVFKGKQAIYGLNLNYSQFAGLFSGWRNM